MLKSLVERELALANSVVEAANHPTKKAHDPTTEYFKGMSVAYKKVLSVLEIEKIVPNTPILIEKHYRFSISRIGLAFLAGCAILYFVLK